MTNTTIREDFREILRLVRPGSRVLDVGCGEGALLDLLGHEKQVDGRGLEISASGVAACMPSKHRGWSLVLVGGLGAVGGYLASSGLSALLQPEFGWRIMSISPVIFPPGRARLAISP